MPRLGFANENDQPYPCDECCIEEEGDGITCLCCSNDEPQFISVAISGITNDDCGTCTGFNGVFVAEQTAGNVCRWVFNFNESGSGCDLRDLIITHNADNFIAPCIGTCCTIVSIRVFGPPFGGVNFRKSDWGVPGDPIDCTFSSIDIPFWNDVLCDGSAATCTLTGV